MYPLATFPTQRSMVTDLTGVINSVCSGRYAVSKQQVDDGAIVFGSTKPRMDKVPRLVSLENGAEFTPYVSAWIDESPQARKGTPFFRDIAFVQRLARKAVNFAKAERNDILRIDEEADKWAQRAAEAKSLAKRENGNKAKKHEAVTIKTATRAGMLYALIGDSRDLFIAQDLMVSSAEMLQSNSRPIAGAAMLGFAANLMETQRSTAERALELHRDAADMFAGSVDDVDDPSSSLDRIFFALVNKPRGGKARHLLSGLATIQAERGDFTSASGNNLRAALAIAKSAEPEEKKWQSVQSHLDKAVRQWWHMHETGMINIDDIFPEVRTTEHMVFQAGALRLQARYGHIVDLRKLNYIPSEADLARMEVLHRRYVDHIAGYESYGDMGLR